MRESNLIMKIAWFYYIDNLTQQQIAEKLDISRMKVIKYLNQAKTEGVVQFKINKNAENRVQAEVKLIEKYGLDDVFVVPNSGSEDLNDTIAQAAAQYIEEKSKPGDYINIGYGDTVSKTVSHLIYAVEKPLSLVSLSGGVSFYTSSIINGAHKKTASSPTPNIYVVPAPLVASSKEVAQTILKESSIKEILDMTQLASMSVVGIGAVTNTATIFKYNIVSNNDLVLLQMQGAVGDILSHFYDKDGNIIENELNARLISSDLSLLKNGKKVIGVAGGKDKVTAIHSALSGKLVNVFITDEDTAARLLEYK
ncbi:MAG: sugar-binding transcriptional regulator [Clostridia bacterium]|nr:sugar-binding transcriptional regulator [Clostridia bacterium]